MVYEVNTRDMPRQVLVTIRARVPHGGLSTFIGAALGRIYPELRHLGATPIGAPFLIYHEFRPDGIDVQACVPVDRSVSPFDPLTVLIEPAGRIAHTLHVGPYAQLRFAHEALTEWLAAHGYRETGPVRERYLDGPGEAADPATFRTQIEVPVEVVRGARSDRGEPLDPDRRGLELGRAGLGIRGIDRQQVGGHVVLEMERHEGEPRPQRGIDPRRDVDLSPPRDDAHPLAIGDAQRMGVLRGDVQALTPPQR